ncbi:MAG TPA: tetratricopeptide repeat protein [Chitinophagaceae bacterium]|jgi:tetratricopeptide (TPR) repeat protein|nr:tetratricopeptide repeat protein [Chitinophagaceae bacterium]
MRNIKGFLMLFLVSVSGLTVAYGQNADIRMADSLYSLEQWEKALPLYEKALASSPQAPLLYSKAGFCYFNLGKNDKALERYQKALEYKFVQPGGKAIVEMRIARVFAKTGRAEKAFEFIDSSLAHGYPELNEFEAVAEFASIRTTQKYKERRDLLFKSVYPCSSDPRKREFDFWVGEWDVYNPGNLLVGHSLIQKIAGECVILENWTGLRGGTYEGKSVNFYDPAKEKWQQFWMGSYAELSNSEEGEYIDYTSNAMPAYKGFGMRFKRKDKDNNGEYIANFVFFNLGPDKVRQFLEKSYDGGKTWVVGLNLTYVRKK